MRWILYPFLKPSSYAKAASILLAKDPSKAFEMNEAVFDTVLEEGGIKGAIEIPAATKKDLYKNFSFAHKYQLLSTPTIIYFAEGGNVKILKGALPNSMMKGWIVSIKEIFENKI